MVIGAQLRFSRNQCTVLQTYAGLIKNSQTQNGIRSPISDLSLSIQGNQELDLCPENVGRASRFSPLWSALRCSLTIENKWLSCFCVKAGALMKTGSLSLSGPTTSLTCQEWAKHWSSYFGDVLQTLLPSWFEALSTIFHASKHIYLFLPFQNSPGISPLHEPLGVHLPSSSQVHAWGNKVYSKFCCAPPGTMCLSPSSARFTATAVTCNLLQRPSLSCQYHLAWKHPEPEVPGSLHSCHPGLMAAWCGKVKAQLSCQELGQTLKYNWDFSSPPGTRLRMGPHLKSHTCLAFLPYLSCSPPPSIPTPLPGFSSEHFITKPFTQESSSQGLFPKLT